MAGRIGSQGMVSIKVSKNVSCQALWSFRLLLKKAQHFARTSIFFFGSCSSLRVRSVHPQGLLTLTCSGYQLVSILENQSEVEVSLVFAFACCSNGGCASRSALESWQWRWTRVLSFDAEKVSGGEDDGIETHILRCSGTGIVLRKSR